MKKYLGLLLLLVSFTSFGQFSNYTNINGRYKWIAGKFDSTFTIPSGTTPSLRVGGGTGPGALFYSTTDSTVYQYTGTRWTRLRGTDTAHVVSAYVRNTTASTMTAGQVVYINGSTGTTPTIALAVNTADSTSAMTFGFVRGTIAPNAFGWITTFGPLEGVNTNAYTEGEVIYLDSIPGQFTHDKPQAPYHMVTLGYIVKKSGGNGTIFAKIQNGYELEELHNVRITSPVRNNGILAYDSVAQLWKDTTLSAIGGVTGSGTSGQVAYWTGTSSQSGSSTFLFSPTSELDLANSVTASSAIARGIRLRPTLTAAANNDVLVGLDVNPTFTSGAFTGLQRVGTRISYNNNLGGVISTLRLVNSSAGTAQSRLDLWNNGSTTTEGPTGGAALFYCANDYGSNFSSALGFWNYQNGPIVLATNNSQRVTIFANGNFGINTGFTDGGQRLQVTGDVLFKGSGNTSGTTALTVQNSDGTNLLRVRNDNTALFGGAAQFASFLANTTASSPLQIRANVASLTSLSVDFTSSITAASGAYNVISTAQGFAPTSGTATFTNLLIQPTINQTGGANGITRGLYVNPTLTAAADWRSIEWSNNSGWGLYGAGSANNYLGGNLGIGSTSLTNTNLRITKNITGNVVASGLVINSQIQSDVTSQAIYFNSISNTQDAAFTTEIRHFQAQQGTFGASSTVTNQYGFVAESNLTGATNNFGFRGNIASGTGRWNLYMNGTAANYMNGNLLLGSTTDGGQKLQVTGTTQLTPAANSSALTSTGYSFTSGSASAISLSGTWNSGGVTPPAFILANVTNTASAGVGRLIDLQVGGVTQFNVDRLSQLTMVAHSLTRWLSTTGNENGITFSATSIKTSGDATGLNLTGSFSTSSGTATLALISLQGAINQTGGANGITRGLYINPTLTAAADWRSLEWSNNTGWGLYGSGSATNYIEGSVGIGTNTMDASAKLEIKATNKGFLPPRGTNAQMLAIVNPAEGLLFFDITNKQLNVFDGTNWIPLN